MQVLLDAGDHPSPGLSDAVHRNRTDLVNLLLASGATYKVNAGSGMELYYACKSGCRKWMEIILDAGVSPVASRGASKGECMRQACCDGSLSSWIPKAATHFLGYMSRSFGHGEDPT